MPMPRTRRTAEDAREAIRGAAVELFVAGGYGATSLEDIARRVGLTRQAALYHFKTKEDLLRSVVDPYLDEVTRLLDPIEVSELPTAAERRATLTALVDVLVAHRGVVSLLSRFTTASTIAGLGPRLVELGTRMRTVLVGPAVATDSAARIRGYAATAALIGVMSAREEIPLTDPAERLALIDAVMAMLGADGERQPGT
ncbi:MAG: TetR/AcrR family transcriptional regulator [Nocardioides sp.]